MSVSVCLKRIYDKPEKEDGIRILVDGIWPRGVSKKDAALDHWLKQVAPSKELRHWFNHDPDKFHSFSEKYKKELRQNREKEEALNQLIQIVNESEDHVTLLFAAKDKENNQATVLKELLTR